MSTLTLYEHELSGNSYKVRLFLSLLGLPFTARRVDLFKGEGQNPDYRAISALGQVPALMDGGEAVRDSQAILFYVARTHGQVAGWPTMLSVNRAQWLGSRSPQTNWPTGPPRCASQWRFKRPVDTDWATVVTQRAFGLMQSTLASQPWLMPGEHPSIADIGLLPLHRASARRQRLAGRLPRHHRVVRPHSRAAGLRRHGGRLAPAARQLEPTSISSPQTGFAALSPFSAPEGWPRAEPGPARLFNARRPRCQTLSKPTTSAPPPYGALAERPTTVSAVASPTRSNTPWCG